MEGRGSFKSWLFYSREEALTHIEYEVGWASEAVWMFWRTEKYLAFARI
jgi:hypothetical protein